MLDEFILNLCRGTLGLFIYAMLLRVLENRFEEEDESETEETQGGFIASVPFLASIEQAISSILDTIDSHSQEKFGFTFSLLFGIGFMSYLGGQVLFPSNFSETISDFNEIFPNLIAQFIPISSVSVTALGLTMMVILAVGQYVGEDIELFEWGSYSEAIYMFISVILIIF